VAKADAEAAWPDGNEVERGIVTWRATAAVAIQSLERSAARESRWKTRSSRGVGVSAMAT
jgi:hypothetical protein